ncbi:MFS transporter [Cellulomonas alba]|uniref:MFS transporter n=1 Tax=Cellulomonas alba TaxID=3053467 RepID=A0ABT7SFX7_9CELL|nr:MFS transporter [Cellulomonas alba]MDM7855078.1 MFS transporter [Cellulomonas alba]
MPLLPWPSLLVLGGATFAMVSAEMLPTAVLTPMSTDLGVSTARGGALVAVWAATVVVTTFPLARLTRRHERRAVIAAALLALGASAVLTALAPGYDVALVSRVLGAAACGLLWSAVNAHVADLVDERLLARAVAVVLGGATLGMVLGAPVASLVARVASWRVAFGLLAGATVVAAVLVRAVVQGTAGAAGSRAGGADDDSAAPAALDAPAAGAGRGLRTVVAVSALVGLVLVGHFAAYTFITRLVAPTADALPGGVSGLLLLFGGTSALAVVLVGRFGDRRLHAALVGAGVAVGLALASLLVVGAHPVVTVLLVAAWGLASGALPPLAQPTILRVAGPAHRATAGTVIPVVFNLGIAVGAAAGSALVAGAGPDAVPVPAAAVAIVASLGLVRVLRPAPRRSASVTRARGAASVPAACPG